MLVEKEPPAETLHSLPGPKSFGSNAEETLIGRRTARVSPLTRNPDEVRKSAPYPWRIEVVPRIIQPFVLYG